MCTNTITVVSITLLVNNVLLQNLSQDLCLNGGTLLPIDGEYACSCAMYYYGLRCELKYVNTFSNNCSDVIHPEIASKQLKLHSKHHTGFKKHKVSIKNHRWLTKWRQYLIDNKECICSCKKI